MSKLGYQSTPGEKNIILEEVKKAPQHERAYLKSIFDKLAKDGHKALETFNSRPVVKPYVYEIKKGPWRIFYTEAENKIIVVHICYKEKNKTKLCDKNTASERAKEIHKYGIENCNIIYH